MRGPRKLSVWRAAGYGGRALRTASQCARALRFEYRDLTLRAVARVLIQLPALIAYLWLLPRLEVRFSDNPSGKLLAEHLSLRRWGLPRFRLAQGVLQLPTDFSTYLRGRRRQALRTNMRRARERGIQCSEAVVPTAMRAELKRTRNTPTERWRAFDRDGNVVGEALLTVDQECALLHGMGCREQDVRWLLHTAIVERLCGSGCRLLLTNSHDAPLLPPGQQHFQHLLGYSVARLRPRAPRVASTTRRRLVSAFALGTVASGAIVGQHVLPSPLQSMHLAGHRALVWLAALAAVRVAANRVGLTTLVGGVAGLELVLLGETPEVGLAYFLCGVTLDAVLALFPRFADHPIAMSAVGAAVIFVALLAPAFPTLGHDAAAGQTIPPVLGAILFGALGAGLGQSVGRRSRRFAGF